MARGWSRSTERRRGLSTLVSAMAAALPSCREPRLLRQRFEQELCELMNAREVELRDGPAMPRPPASAISLEVSCGEFTLGAIDAVFDNASCAFDEWDQQMLESARAMALRAEARARELGDADTAAEIASHARRYRR